MCKLEFSRVLHGQDNRYLLHAIQRLRNVRRENSARIDLRIVEESVCSLEFRWFERLGKRGLRCASEPTRQSDKSSHRACIAKIRFAELGTCPIIGIATHANVETSEALVVSICTFVYQIVVFRLLVRLGLPEIGQLAPASENNDENARAFERFECTARAAVRR